MSYIYLLSPPYRVGHEPSETYLKGHYAKNKDGHIFDAKIL